MVIKGAWIPTGKVNVRELVVKYRKTTPATKNLQLKKALQEKSFGGLFGVSKGGTITTNHGYGSIGQEVQPETYRNSGKSWLQKLAN